ncbi:MAG: hypothetical protein D6772_03615 [Bacteroidetes bacterium]|nr:MAG: hypothetical protein D6772_03615 [Bacteroidota bacterium]
MKAHGFLLLVVVAGYLLLQMSACKHDPFISEDDMMPIDTTGNPVDTMGNPVDTMGTPCDSTLVYFERDILPLLNSNCAFSGCHDAASARDGVNLTTYEAVINTAEVQPFDLSDSELYEVITDSDPDDRMPPPPRAPLSSTQINLIARWILQGADNLSCDPGAGSCETSSVSYLQNLVPLLQTHCVGCHSGSTPSANINLSTYAGVRAVGLNGRLVGAIRHDSGFSAMPQGGAKLDDCSIRQFEAWVADGAPEN